MLEKTTTVKTGGLLENVLVLGMITIGFWGLTMFFTSRPNPRSYLRGSQAVLYQPAGLSSMPRHWFQTYGPLVSGQPVRFELHLPSSVKRPYLINFGEGSQQLVDTNSFLFTFPKPGTYRVEVNSRQEGEKPYFALLKITSD